MVEYRLTGVEYRLAGEESDSWLTGNQGAAQLREPQIAAAIMIRAEFDDDQLRNFIALLVKSWEHLSPVLLGGPPINAWHMVNFTKEAVAGSLPVDIRFWPENHCWRFNARPRTGCVASTTLRLANMAEWAQRYSDRIKLTGESALKRQTYDDITAHRRQGIAFRPREVLAAADAAAQ